MEALSKIANNLEAPQQSDRLSLTRGSGISLPEGTGLALLLLMRQTCSRFPNQFIPEESQEMYQVEWEEMAARYSLEMFRDGLSKALHDGRSFFPAPEDIRAYCRSLYADKRNREEAAKREAEDAAAKALWEREREEERVYGKPERSETEIRLDALLEKTRIEKVRNRPYYGPPPIYLTPEQIKEHVAVEAAR